MPTLIILLALGGADPAPGGPAVSPAEVRRVLAALVQAAERNRQRDRPRTGDALADQLVRHAARYTAEQGISPRAFLVALGVGLDRTDVLRSHRLTGWYLRQIESDAERQRRLRVLGNPTLKGRPDWLYHFAVSAALAALTGPAAAEAAGLYKELRDAEGGSGFSFADLAADYSGVFFARTLLAPGPDAGRELTRIAEGFRGAALLPETSDLKEGLSRAELERRYGGPDDERFRRACAAVRRRVERLPAFRDLAGERR
jgi:hypothetical protein